MTTCFTCKEPTEDGAEFCSPACFWEGEAELGVSLTGRSIAEALAAKEEAAASAGDGEA
ncbi:hypothetical protein [Glycomyces paridis]|uniref:hypothetical protein n=1 Tax=Glycomyces paridis TaxID=2126555 RepID=UPI00130510A1|nr:hypothetical protein [Glycomyces paridis]